MDTSWYKRMEENKLVKEPFNLRLIYSLSIMNARHLFKEFEKIASINKECPC